MSKVLAACADITGSDRQIDIAWVTEGHRVHSGRVAGASGVLDWVKANRPHVLAIDGPSGPNLGKTLVRAIREHHGWEGKFVRGSSRTGEGRLPLYARMRLCEALLISRRVFAYNTPPERERIASWIETGWTIFGALSEDGGYRLWNQPGRVRIGGQPVIVEVYPHACFVVGLGWIPQKKGTLGGQLERVSYLRSVLARDGGTLVSDELPSDDWLSAFGELINRATWDDIRRMGIRLPALRHDFLDAFAGLTTALVCLESGGYAVGDPDEGVIVLPREPIPLGKSYEERPGG